MYNRCFNENTCNILNKPISYNTPPNTNKSHAHYLAYDKFACLTS